MRIPQYAFAALLLPLTSPWQQSQPAPRVGQEGSYTLTTREKLVVLDVIVTDKQGNPVTNLKKEDFEVQEDKLPQRIYSFEAPAAHALSPDITINSTEELDRKAPNASANIIVLDESVERFEDQYFARYSIQQYLKVQPDKLPQPTMLVAINVDHMIVLRDYTQDKQAILSALNHHFAGSAGYSGSVPRNGLGFVGYEVQAGYRSLVQVAQATAGHPGHKNVIWVGRGLPRLVVGIKMLPDDVLVSPDVGQRLHVALQKVINLLVASRVTLYTIDPRGVGMGRDPFGGIANFADVAVATGGGLVYNRNDVDVAIASSARNGSEFYTLSYIPSSANDKPGSLRKIRIVMKNPSLHAVARTGYFSDSKANTQELATTHTSTQPVLSHAIDKTLVNTTLIYDGIPITVAKMDKPGYVAVRMNIDALQWIDHGPSESRTSPVQVSCVSFDKKDKVLVHEGANVDVLSPAVSTGNSQEVGLSLKCDTDPRAVRLRVVVEAADTGKIGTANLNLAGEAAK